MSDLKLFDNKQMIHIASEVVILVGLIFYFSSKNKKLLGHVEELAQRLEEQEDHIQKLETALHQIGQKMDNLIQQMGQNLSNNFSEQIKPQKNHNQAQPPPVLKHNKSSPKVQFNIPSPTEEELEEELDDSDLDDEIRSELEELVEDDLSLKKEK